MFTHDSFVERGISRAAKGLLKAFQYRGDILPYTLVTIDFDKTYYLFHLAFLTKLEVYLYTGENNFLNKHELEIVGLMQEQVDNGSLVDSNGNVRVAETKMLEHLSKQLVGLKALEDKANSSISDQELLNQFKKVDKFPLEKKKLVKEFLGAFILTTNLQQQLVSS